MKSFNIKASWLGASLGAAIVLFTSQTAQAVPYASGIINQSGTISFILNENADNVKVIFNGGGPGKTNDLGALAKGSHSFSLGANTSYEIHVTKSAAPSWSLISDDLNPLVRFYAPRGLAVFNDPSDLTRFGRLYVASTAAGATTAAPTASGRTTGKGIYMLNADQSDALGYGATEQTAGITFNVSSSSPFRVEVGADKKLYISDFSNPAATIYRSDADVSAASGEVVLEGIGYNVNPTVHTDINGSSIAKGSLATGDLQVWAIDGQWSNGRNRLLRWDINAGPLPHNQPPAELGTAGNPGVSSVQSDLDIAPDGKFFLCQFRSASPTPGYDAGRVNLRVYDTTGTNLLFDSLRTSVDMGATTDYLNDSRALKVSPNGRRLAIMRNDTQVWILPLTNGIPDLSGRSLLNAFGATAGSSTGRDLSWDLAGNLYVGNANHEKVRVWSPGGSFTAITRSSGTFELTAPPTIVTAAADLTTTSENGTNPTFTISREGDTSSSLPVNYTLAGSAVSGTDYDAVSGIVTFLPGATSTNLTINMLNDSIAEPIKTLVFTLAGGANYSIGSAAITVALLDDELPQLGLTATQPSILEGSAGSKATFTLNRIGQTNVALTANVSYSGSATLGSDYNGPATVSIPAGAVNVTFNVAGINDKIVEGTESLAATLQSGSGYNLGANISASASIIDEDLTPGDVLFGDGFNDFLETLTKWSVIYGPNDTLVEHHYDYSVNGIPEAPNSAVSDLPTRGIKMYLNQTAQFVNGVGISPNTSFSGDYRLVFDGWINYNGPLSGGGSGSSEFLGAGVGTPFMLEPITAPAGTFTDGVWFAVAGDGGFLDEGIPGDWQAWITNSLLSSSTGAYAAGAGSNARGNFHPYYAEWGGVSAPASQVADYPAQQTGTTDPGAPGFGWHKFVVAKQGTNVTWTIDGKLVANVNSTGISMSTNVMINYTDQFVSAASSSAATNVVLRYAIVDNVKIETIPAPLTPAEIKAIRLINNGTQVQIDFAGATGDTPASFKVSASGNVASGYMDVAATITSLGGNNFRAVLSASGAAQFYRVRR